MLDDILDVAQSETRLASRIRQMLGALADGENKLIRETACGVPAGAPLRKSALSNAYGEELGSAFGTFWAKYQGMPTVEPEDVEQLGREYLDSTCEQSAATASHRV